jgi:hypothetical protein
VDRDVSAVSVVVTVLVAILRAFDEHRRAGDRHAAYERRRRDRRRSPGRRRADDQP